MYMDLAILPLLLEVGTSDALWASHIISDCLLCQEHRIAGVHAIGQYRSEVWVGLMQGTVDLVPGVDESSTVEFAEASEHVIGIILPPTSTGATHPMLDNVVTAALHRSTPDRIAFGPELVVPRMCARLDSK